MPDQQGIRPIAISRPRHAAPRSPNAERQVKKIRGFTHRGGSTLSPLASTTHIRPRRVSSPLQRLDALHLYVIHTHLPVTHLLNRAKALPWASAKSVVLLVRSMASGADSIVGMVAGAGKSCCG
jgi:hypothetical protein